MDKLDVLSDDDAAAAADDDAVVDCTRRCANGDADRSDEGALFVEPAALLGSNHSSQISTASDRATHDVCSLRKKIVRSKSKIGCCNAMALAIIGCMFTALDCVPKPRRGDPPLGSIRDLDGLSPIVSIVASGIGVATVCAPDRAFTSA